MCCYAHFILWATEFEAGCISCGLETSWEKLICLGPLSSANHLPIISKVITSNINSREKCFQVPLQVVDVGGGKALFYTFISVWFNLHHPFSSCAAETAAFHLVHSCVYRGTWRKRKQNKCDQLSAARTGMGLWGPVSRPSAFQGPPP